MNLSKPCVLNMAQALYTDRFKKDFQKLPSELQLATEKQIRLLLENRAYPSLQLKKMKGYENIWEVRVSHGYRISLSIEPEAFVLHRVGQHDIVRNPV